MLTDHYQREQWARRQSRRRRRLRRLARIAVGCPSPMRCQGCGGRRRLQFAHLRPTGLCGPGRGSYRRYTDVLAHPDHYAALCATCHHYLDHGCDSGPEADW